MFFKESLALKVVSLLFALILWITILGFKKEEVRRSVRLEPMLPPGMMVTNKIPSQIQFTLLGPRLLLKDLDRKLQPIRPDLRRTGETTIGFSVNEDLLGDLPPGVRVISFYPSNILIHLESAITKALPIKVITVGRVAEGYTVRKIEIEPKEVVVSGPKGALKVLTAVDTEPLNLTGLEKTGSQSVELDSETLQGLQIEGDRHVRVTVTVVPRKLSAKDL